MSPAPAELATQPLFNGLTEAQLAVLAPLFAEHYFGGDEQIFMQGARATWAYILRAGRVDLHLQPEDGGHFCIAQIAPNGVFGWSAVLGHKRYTSTAVSVGLSQAWAVMGHTLRKLLHTDVVLGRLLLDRMTRTVIGRVSLPPTQIAHLIEREMTLA